MSMQDSTTTMAAAKEEEEKSVTKVFSMINLDDGLIILEDGKRMPSNLYEDESITENIKRIELENKDLENMLCSLQTTIEKVSEELKAKLEIYDELSSREREHPELVGVDAAIAEFKKKEEAAVAGKKQQELDKIKHGQKLTRLEAECDGCDEGGSKWKRIAKRDLSKKCPWK